MENEKEVNPLSSGTEGVSLNDATAGGAEPPATGLVQETPASEPNRKGRGIDLWSLTPEEAKAHKKAIRDKSQKKRSERKKAASYVFDSATEPSKPEAKRLLQERGLRNPHVLDVVHKALLRAAELNGIPANRFLFANGLVQTLRSIEACEAQVLPEIPAEPVGGELLNRAELYALYDACVAPFEETTFDEYLAIRQNCKRDCYYLGKEILQKDFEEIHEEWSLWLPKFDPADLPPNYTQRQAIEWLKAQAPDIKEFLMIASRSSFKSSFSHIWILTAVLCLPDIRILLVSETRPLSKDFIGVIRSYFEVQEGFETRFQRLFAEYTIPMGDGSVLSLECPMARLRLAQSIESTSMDSTVAGKRSDIIVFDDPISNQTVGNDTQIQASVNKRDALVKLGEAGARIILTIGTPWHANDLYAQLIQRNQSVQEPFMRYRIDPAFTVKPHARHKLTVTSLQTLVESDIEKYLFTRFTWKGMVSEMTSPAFFLSQNLCIFPKGDEEGLRVTFTEDDLRAHLRRAEFFGSLLGAQTVMTIDRAYSTAMFADFSVVTVGKIMPVIAREGAKPKTSVVVWDVRLERWKESELVKNIIDMMELHKPTHFVAEKDKGHESLDLAIRKLAMLRGVALPYMRWVVTNPGGSKNPMQKAKRIKKLENPLANDTLWFRTAAWNDAVFAQFTKMDGGIFVDSNSHRKLDAPDCISLLHEQFGPRNLTDEVEDPKEAARRKQEEEEEQEREQRRAYHQRMFSDSSYMPAKPVEPPPTQQPAQPIRFPRGGGFAVLPSSMTRRNR